MVGQEQLGTKWGLICGKQSKHLNCFGASKGRNYLETTKERVGMVPMQGHAGRHTGTG